ncbi:hypothetical protein PV327_009468 [Microctonus hyperodae]|uniref:Uncharacterized protein n=1 Tax=Microctonus hyperodae TaxID=165561 RepID=A0AA39FUF7_MICHY|nr:hypothetical protein PV327_009468 [Microctonus hyperodae]
MENESRSGKGERWKDIGRERKACFPGTSRGAVSRRYCSANPRRVRVTNDAVIRPLVFLKAVPTLGKNQWKSPVAQGYTERPLARDSMRLPRRFLQHFS